MMSRGRQPLAIPSAYDTEHFQNMEKIKECTVVPLARYLGVVRDEQIQIPANLHLMNLVIL
jgi:hypothetical protein